MSNTLYRVTCGQFTGGLVFDETGTVTKTAPFLSRLHGKHLLYTLSHILSWDGAIIERVSPGQEPDIPKGIPTRKEAFASLDDKDPEDEEEADPEPCPECDGFLIAQIGGGVKCNKCPYWFCY